MMEEMRKRLTKNILVSLGIPLVFVPGLILASVLGWNWKQDLGRLGVRGGFYQSEVLFPKKAMVDKVIDGDTLELRNGRVVRLVGVNAPGRGEDLYEKALAFSVKMVEGKNVKLEYDRYQDDKFGRILGYVWIKEGEDGEGVEEMLNLKLVEQGLAKMEIYQDRAKLKYQDLLLEAEEKAKKEGKGMWKE